MDEPTHENIDAESVEALAKGLQHKDGKVRYDAAIKLAKFVKQNREILPRLFSALTHSVEALAKALQHKDETVRYDAATKLAQLAKQNRELLPCLFSALTHEDPRVRQVVTNVIVEDAQKLRMEYVVFLVDALIGALVHKDVGIRRDSAWALNHLITREEITAAEGTISVALRALEDESAEVRSAAALILGKLRPTTEKVIPALINMLKDESVEVRHTTVLALCKFGPEAKEAAPALLETLKDEDSDTCYNALQALKKIGVPGRDRVPGLIEALKSNNAGARANAAVGLHCLKCIAIDAVPALLISLKDEDAEVRRVTALALGTTGANKAIPALIEAVEDSEENVRIEAIEALGNFKSRAGAAVPILIHALRDKALCEWATTALEKIGRKTGEGMPALIPAVKDSQPQVRLFAAEALGNIAYQIKDAKDVKDAISALMELRNDQDDEIRFTARELLYNISPKDFPLDDEDWKLRLLPREARKTRRSACPSCGSKRIGSILYGLMDPEDCPSKDSGIRLGGCCIEPGCPYWFCRDCEAEW